MKAYPVPSKMPAGCQRCNWLGVFEAPFVDAVCPSCASAVVPLRQKGLDNLRAYYRNLGKIGFSSQLTVNVRGIERARIEQFFETIGEPLRS